MLLPAREQSSAEYVKNDLRLRYFKRQPVQMELVTDGDEVLADTDEIVDKMRLKVRVDNQVRPSSHPFARQILLSGCFACNNSRAICRGIRRRLLWNSGRILHQKRRPRRWLYQGIEVPRNPALHLAASENPKAGACLRAAPRRLTASVEDQTRGSHQLAHNVGGLD